MVWKNLLVRVSSVVQRAEAGVHPADGGAEALASADGASVPCPCLTQPGDDPLREPNISNLSLPLFVVSLPYALVKNASDQGAIKKLKKKTSKSITLATGCKFTNLVQSKRFPQACSGVGGDALVPQEHRLRAPKGVAASNTLHAA